jgi:hypothetical protein
MKKITIVSILLCAQILPSIWAEEQANLPREAKRLISLLETYEKKERARIEEIISKKRKEVIVALKKQVRAYTKRGDLEGAVLVKAEVVRLLTLNRMGIPDLIRPKSYSLEKNGKLYNPAEMPQDFAVDGDKEKGKITLNIEHEDLARIIDSAKVIYLVFHISEIKSAETEGTLVAKVSGRVVGQLKGAQRGALAKIKIDPWKIGNLNTKLSIALECLAEDGITVVLGAGSKSPHLEIESR